MGLVFLLLFTLVQGEPGSGTTIGGVVLEAESNRPLASVAVQAGPRRAITDANGRFELKGVMGGRIALTGFKDGFTPMQIDRREHVDTGVDLTLAAGERLADLVLYMHPTGVATGQIFDTTGQPVRGALVAPYRYGYAGSGELALNAISERPLVASGANLLGVVTAGTPFSGSSERTRGGVTNERGEFRIYNLDPGVYSFAVHPPYLPILPGQPAYLRLLPVYYPGVEGLKDAGTIDIRGGTETRLNSVVLPAGSGGLLQMKVDDRTGQSAMTGGVEIRRKGSQLPVFRSSYYSGLANIQTRLPPGHYEAEVILGDFALPLSVAAGRTEFDMPGGDAAITVTVPRSVPLSGLAEFASGQRPPRPVSGVRLLLRSPEVFSSLTFSLTSDSSGTLSARGIPRGAYTTTVSGTTNGLCLSGIRQGERNVLRDGLLVEEADVDVSIMFRESDTVVQGTVAASTGSAAKGAVIVLIPEDRAQLDLYTVTTSDQNGRFEMQCLDPGDYRLYAWSAMEGAAYRNTKFMEKYDNAGATVHIVQGSQVNVDIRTQDE